MNRGRKFAGLVLSAMVFGAVSGGTMVGVNVLSNQYRNEVLSETADSGKTSSDAGALDRQNSSKAEEKSSGVQKTANGKESTETSETVSGIVKEAMPEVVSITNTIRYQQYGYNIFGESGQQEAAASGSGVIIGKIRSF